MLSDALKEAMKEAMKAKEPERLSTLRLINAAVKDREIALRASGDENLKVDDAEIVLILTKMVRQRHESARAYEEGGRLELAQKELAEVSVIEEFLPRQLSKDEVNIAIEKAITQAGASSIRDIGAVMKLLKEHYAGQMDFSAVGLMVKARLG